MSLLLPLLLASATTTIDGNAALDHARRLAALGPHPWGSPRAEVAAQYVESQLRDIGLSEVRRESFESRGLIGTNIVGVLRSPGPEFLVVGAHHDTAPAAPGAYDDGGGVGVLIEVARVLFQQGERPRTILFVSWDAEEAFSQHRDAKAEGSRAFIKALGQERENLVAVVDVEMSGYAKGVPNIHPIAYADPNRPGRYVIAPGWLVRAAVTAARQSRVPLHVGDPLLAWLYQPVVRTLRAPLYGDDLSFVQAGLPAIFLSDSSISAFYPWYHEPGDTADKLDGAALTRMGEAVLAIVTELEKTPRGPAVDETWYAAVGDVWGASVVWGLGLVCLVPGLLVASRRGGFALGLRLAYTACVVTLLWRNPVPTVWVFFLPSLLPLLYRRLWVSLVSLLPLLALVGLGAYAWRAGAVVGVWLAPWEMGVAGVALLLVWFLPARRKGARRKADSGAGGGGRGGRRGLPRN